MTAAAFLDALRASGILTEDRLTLVLRETADSLKEGEAKPLARDLVRRVVLTKYQTAALREGKSSGLVLGNYVILDLLGRGGMGVVFKARHQRMDRLVALKIVSPKVVGDTAAVARFHREVIAAARLNHPHIVTAFDADLAKGVHFLVMEFVEGIDLAEHVKKRGPLPVAEVIDLVIQAAHGLAHAHAAGIVHRDIKPNNLLLDQKGVVKVLDMGLARIADPLPVEGRPATDAVGDETAFFPAPIRNEPSALTASGMILGTIDYIAPEQVDDTHQADARSDIYSLGCTLFFLLTARPVYFYPTVAERLYAHYHAKPPTLRSIRGEIPEPLDQLFLEMVAKSPADRPPTMDEVIRRLERVRSVPAVTDSLEPAAHPLASLNPVNTVSALTPVPMGLSSLLNLNFDEHETESSLIHPNANREATAFARVFARTGGTTPIIVAMVVLMAVGLGGWRFLTGVRSSSSTDSDASRVSRALELERQSRSEPRVQPAPTSSPLIVTSEPMTQESETPTSVEPHPEPAPATPGPPAMTVPPVVATTTAPPVLDPAAFVGTPVARLAVMVEQTESAFTPAKIGALRDAFESLLLDHPKSPTTDIPSRLLWQKADEARKKLRKREELSRWILLDGTKAELLSWVDQRKSEGRRPAQIHVHNLGKTAKFTAISAPMEPGIDVTWEVMNAPFSQVHERFMNPDWRLVTHSSYWLEDGRDESVALFRTESSRLAPIFANTNWGYGSMDKVNQLITRVKRGGEEMPFWIAGNLKDDGEMGFMILPRLSLGADWQMKGPLTLDEWKTTAITAQTAHLIPLTLWLWPTPEGPRFGVIFAKTLANFLPWTTSTVHDADEFWPLYFSRIAAGYELGWIVGYAEAGESRHIVLWYPTAGALIRGKKRG